MSAKELRYVAHADADADADDDDDDDGGCGAMPEQTTRFLTGDIWKLSVNISEGWSRGWKWKVESAEKGKRRRGGKNEDRETVGTERPGETLADVRSKLLSLSCFAWTEPFPLPPSYCSFYSPTVIFNVLERGSRKFPVKFKANFVC
ncbi:hypothetical protein KQX54_004902 [Cotesia glomerata]|uniref:Uncharacterized protein n=1 Tax=Cotesia glomerata TaxID=32391 RepID=A0AAV7IBI3_COTGL|nr:hypothetical protein KQX54_004902 [Cotesia glomerata]